MNTLDMAEKTKITFEMSGYTFSGELDHDANMVEALDIFISLCKAQSYPNELIEKTIKNYINDLY